MLSYTRRYGVRQKIPVLFEAICISQFLEQEENKIMVTKNAHSTVILHDNNFPHLHTVHAVKTSL